MEPRDLGIYLSPDQERPVLEQASSRAAAGRGQEEWANPCAFFVPEDASLADVHRIAYTYQRTRHLAPVTEVQHMVQQAIPIAQPVTMRESEALPELRASNAPRV